MTKILVDDVEVDVPAEYTLLQACEEAGAEVPRFCFHERLSIAGNCRMCLVEVKGGPPKPAASCAMSVRDLRPGPNGEPPQVFTKTPMVKKAREGVMEFLLVNHPLDCPICDQGGECDLQDQALAFGGDSSRYAENKRAVEDKYIGPLVKTAMNRCIHCTRCVRFTAEIAGTSDMGAIGRGEDMEITTYLQTAMTSEMQGNVTDLCPVGALLPKPQNFRARPWEYQKTETIDVQDALGSAIRVDARGREVIRILPRVNEAVNEEWISDKTRQVVDGLKVQRLDRPYIRENGKLRAASWQEALAAVAAKTKATAPQKIGALVGDLAALEEIYALKLLVEGLGSVNLDARQDGTKLDPRFGRASYLFNATIAGIDDADSLLIIGSNPRKEAPVLNARIRKRWLRGDFPISLVGEAADLTYDYDYLGAGPDSLSRFLDSAPTGSHKRVVLIGQGALTRPDGRAILALAAQIAKKHGALGDGWNGFSVLHTAAARVGALDLSFTPGQGGLDAGEMAKAGALELIFNLGADEIAIEPGAFVVYFGTHGDKGAHRADVILPGAAYTEKFGLFVNTEGRVQEALRATFPPGDAREDWAILRALSGALGAPLPFDSLAQLRAELAKTHPHIAKLDRIEPANIADLEAVALQPATAWKDDFVAAIADFYLTNPIARASATMAECSALAQGRLSRAAE
ncbi:MULTISPECIES: NADH-quinone oxidoreductase subunit NuoG [Methylosinus]|uniref:NADH-quinone oxidoreductase n=1 Tax=Methylosinus trichosporium (strain ATCC 35070 / NCIMB 11131 / UNIQEM 75 / OB3b) TaxID=595536 RepID=A0A2D2CX89_METT3|nr:MULTISPECIES: NADH-quinone oxidoreductase subunit NuoG [Methylosinus]ATQ67378.1 NADH-quinone oxidoreductase subunit G [Methylosinus trichosporium OB3b]OBS51609.1 NADH-quinone oxidoreductase subunit G [Methylosinus sp. 3S-1]